MKWRISDNQVPEEAEELLSRNAIFVYPTETVYGLGGNPCSQKVVQRIFLLKGRPSGKPVPLIASDMTAVRRATAWWPEAAERLASFFWPGPLTLVLPATSRFPKNVLSSSGTVALRISSHPVASRLARACGGWIIATSANRSGEPPVRDPGDLPEDLVRDVDGILDAGPLPPGVPSTIVRLDRAPGVRWGILREGSISREEIRRVIAGYAVEGQG